MRIGHLESLSPLCPICRASDPTCENPALLTLAEVFREEHSHIIEGILHCTNSSCRGEFPIIDGVPVILSNIRSFVQENLIHFLSRSDLSAPISGLLGDCLSQNSAAETMRRHLSCYMRDHYGDRDQLETAADPPPATLVGIVNRLLAMSERMESGPCLDVGCGVGRSTFEIAAASSQLTLGIDVNFAMMRNASSVLRSGRVVYDRKVCGSVYERREFEFESPASTAVDFWLCDATALPFRDGSFGNVCALNVIDSVPLPLQLIREICRVLRRSGYFCSASPYEWTESVTPIEEWLGGHSSRNSWRGDPIAILRSLLTTGDDGQPGAFSIVDEADRVPWNLRLHDRGFMQYLLHLICARRR